MTISAEPGTTRVTKTQSLNRLFKPQVIAVVGASNSAEKAGGALMDVLRTFPGKLHPINSSADVISGRQAYKAVSDVPDEVDLAVIAVPPAAVADVLRDCGAAGVGAAIICTGGFAESGPEGAQLQAEVIAVAKETGIRLLGPNTSGFIVPALNLHATFMPGVHALPAGNLAIVAQSGGVNLASAFMAAGLGVGISTAVGLGNAVDVDFADVLDHLAQDEDTSAIALHIEGVADGRALMAAIERACARKPVIALKVGKSDVGDFAQSHTGALAGNWAVARAGLAQAGAVVVDSLTDLVEAAAALSVTRLQPSKDPGVGIVTGQAGPGLIIVDTLTSAKVKVPEVSAATTEKLSTLLPPLTYQRNPVDTGRPGPTFVDVLAAVGDDEAIDAVLVYALQEGGTKAVVDALTESSERRSAVPTLMVTGGPEDDVIAQRDALKGSGIWTVATPDRGAFAMSAMIADAKAQHIRAAASAPPVRVADRIPGHSALDENLGKDLLRSIGLRTPRRVACESRDDAEAAFKELNKPIVVKVLDSNVLHKSAAGGVKLGVASLADLAIALEETGRASSSAEARWLLEEQVGQGIELIIGGVNDPSFGAAVIIGAGGVDVEWGQPPVIRTAPLSTVEADEMIRQLPQALIAALGPDVCAELGQVVFDVAAFLAAHPEIKELDINPLRSTPDGLIALDAVFMLDPADAALTFQEDLK
ncbi:CoA-binding protein [Paenarthrobacter sp. CM16]|uniref:acetate--CoA ligase family protein n=1 Tax=Paenarthrobacter sp. CM16 TaxID=2738447 RepID=UPI001554476C|nr:acetate--CoA ligase family protein [Paenarthrobacter sp. CM16]NQD86449.1 CoA-binding protein [Paenarthrobacter sp. CM16]